MPAHRCPTCGTHIEFFRTGHGRRLPFNHYPIPVEEAPYPLGWVTEKRTCRGRPFVVLVPITEVSAAKRANVRHVVLLHLNDQCTRYKDLIEQVTTSTHQGYASRDT